MDAGAIGLGVVGLVVMLVGAEVMVRGAARLATAAGISPLVVGLTVVAFGTSAPEMAVSAVAAIEGRGEVAIGNVVGSNIFNVLVILGLSALVAPLVLAMQLLRIEVPLMIGASLLVWGLAADGSFGRVEGVILFAGIVAYTVFAIRQSRKESAAIQAEFAQELPSPEKERTAQRIAIDSAMVVIGLVLLVLGSRWLVEGAVVVARALGVSELIVGLTIIAAGTSLPEVATSVLATIKGERDIAVGNVVGSNIFNLLAVLGFASVLAPETIAVPRSVLEFDLPVMVGVAVACLPIFFTGSKIARWEAVLFLIWYVAYTALIVLAATGSPALRTLQIALLAFGLPITVVTLGIFVVREWAARRQGAR